MANRRRRPIEDFAPEAARALGYGIIATHHDGRDVYTVVHVKSRNEGGYITDWRPIPDLQHIYPYGIPQAIRVLAMICGVSLARRELIAHSLKLG